MAMNPSLPPLPDIIERLASCWLLALAVAIVPPVMAEESGEAGESERVLRDRAGLEESLEILAGGDAAARRKVAEEACYRFEALESFPYDRDALDRIVEELRRLVRREKDGWISMRLVEEIGCHDPHLLMPLYLDALAGPFPNLRWRVYQHLRWVEEPEAVPLLEEAWPGEKRPWVRKDLIRALAWNGSSRYLEDFRSLAEGDDPDLSSAAIGALILLNDQGAIPLLVHLARDGFWWQRREAADALSLAPESPEALAALLDASGDEDPALRRCAVRSLARRGDPVAIARAVAMTLTDPDRDVRQAGLNTLDGSSWRSITDGILGTTPVDPGGDRDAAEEGILEIVGHLPERASRPNVTLPRRIRRDGREPQCVYWPVGGLDPDNPRSMRASPPAGERSLRCYQYPGVAGDPAVYRRLPRGALLFVEDYFEGWDGPWVRVHGFDTPVACWQPAARVVPADAVDPPEEEEGILQREFDVELVRRAGLFQEGLTALNLLWMILDSSSRLCGCPSLPAIAASPGSPVRSCPDARAGDSDPGADSDP